jgi:hypothetical protein
MRIYVRITYDLKYNKCKINTNINIIDFKFIFRSLCLVRLDYKINLRRKHNVLVIFSVQSQ